MANTSYTFSPLNCIPILQGPLPLRRDIRVGDIHDGDKDSCPLDTG